MIFQKNELSFFNQELAVDNDLADKLFLEYNDFDMRMANWNLIEK